MSERPYIVGNWKMHGTRAMLSEARAIDRAAERLMKVEVALAPPFTLIHATRKEAGLIGVGAQDCHAAEGGAHTGDISAAMIKDAGAGFVIVGHSERRADHRESDADVKAKAEAALAASLSAIVCVGETEAERDAGKAEQVVCRQLEGSLPQVEGAAEKVTVAYEPVWAIGTGRTPTIEDIGAMHAAIRARLAVDLAEPGADPLRRVGQARQRGRNSRRRRSRRRAGRRRQPDGRELPRHHRRRGGEYRGLTGRRL